MRRIPILLLAIALGAVAVGLAATAEGQSGGSTANKVLFGALKGSSETPAGDSDGYGNGGGYGGGYSDRPREMFTTTCDSCGKEARVPFRPTGSKPVYCSDCFRR